MTLWFLSGSRVSNYLGKALAYKDLHKYNFAFKEDNPALSQQTYAAVHGLVANNL